MLPNFSETHGQFRGAWGCKIRRHGWLLVTAIACIPASIGLQTFPRPFQNRNHKARQPGRISILLPADNQFQH